MLSFFGKRFCCSGRAKDNGAPPPLEVCGYWFTNAASLEWRVGTEESRRQHGLQKPDEKSIAWAIVDSSNHMVEWFAGAIDHKGEAATHHTYKGPMQRWGPTSWQCSPAVSLLITNKEYINFQGKELLMSMTINGVRLQRSFALAVEEAPLHLLLDETRQFGWDSLCFEALVQEQGQDSSNEAREAALDPMYGKQFEEEFRQLGGEARTIG